MKMYKLAMIIAILFGNWGLNRKELGALNFQLNIGANTSIRNGEGKPLLELAEESKSAEIIEALKSFSLEKEWSPSATGRLASHSGKELKRKIFLAEEKYGEIVWRKAATEGNLESLETIWRWAKEAELSPGDLLIARSEEGETALHLAAKRNHVAILEKLWDWAEEEQINGNEIKKKKTTASNVPIVAPNVITSLSLTGNRDWVLCIEYEVFI